MVDTHTAMSGHNSKGRHVRCPLPGVVFVARLFTFHLLQFLVLHFEAQTLAA
ncbi:hypothetical protein BgiBS90_026793, partial [Biomphalaria glabrata]